MVFPELVCVAENGLALATSRDGNCSDIVKELCEVIDVLRVVTLRRKRFDWEAVEYVRAFCGKHWGRGTARMDDRITTLQEPKRLVLEARGYLDEAPIGGRRRRMATVTQWNNDLSSALLAAGAVHAKLKIQTCGIWRCLCDCEKCQIFGAII
ncbi:unnamed protein product [Strongylus vulgaris]|uniref:Uncharacterized protein n=1 Tax=Strongylus vulgaris TaxID=40348 RepID=A0A3P7LAM9_STRVU|nr:unnamed protein product [Strongylus vulgaris]